MTLFPIVERELRVAARRRGTYWGRVIAAFLALGTGTVVFLSERQSSPQNLGMALFSSLAVLAFLYCLLAGSRLTADSVSEEKREGTLGLLFLTDLQGYDVVLGKLAASSLSAVYGLMAIIPVLGLSLLFGGVSAPQFARVALVLLNTCFFSLSAGMLVSAWLEHGRRAMVLTAVLVALVTLGPPAAVLGGAAYRATPPGPAALQWMTPSPGVAFVSALIPANLGPFGGGRGVPDPYLPSMACVFGLGCLCLGFASLILPRVWQDRPAGARRLRWRARWQRWCHGDTATRTAFRRRLLERHPFFWLTARDRLKPAYAWLLLGVVGAFWLFGFFQWPDEWRDAGFYAFTVWALHGVFKFWIALVVVQRLTDDRRSGALELLLVTPLDERALWTGLWRMVRRQFGGPALVLLLADLAACLVTVRAHEQETRFALALTSLHVAMLPVDAFTMVCLAPWLSVATRNPTHAAATLAGLVLVAPWGALMGATIVYSLIDWRVRPDLGEWTVLAIWGGVMLANSLLLGLWGWKRLHREFRTAVAHRYQRDRAGFWRRWFGWV